jgi:hypothetical protein
MPIFTWNNILGNSTYTVKIFRIQENEIRIITGCRNTDSCRCTLKTLKCLPLQSQNVFSLLLFVANKKINSNFIPVSIIYILDKI